MEVCIEVVALKCYGCVNTMLNLAVCTANLHVGSGSLWCEGMNMNVHKSADHSEHVTTFN